MLDAELRQRIDDRIRHSREPRGDAALATASHAEWIGRRRHLADLGPEQWQHVGPRYRIIHQRAGQKLGRVAVIDTFFAKRLPDPLRYATMALPVDQHRVDRPSAIVDRYVADDLDEAGLRIDLHFANRAGIGVRRDAHDLVGNAGQ